MVKSIYNKKYFTKNTLLRQVLKNEEPLSYYCGLESDP